MKSSRLLPYIAFLFFVSILLGSSVSFAGPARTTYQAKIVKPDGYPLEASSVNFKFTILDPSATCILYSENYNSVNMSSTGGLISFSLGSGIKTFPVSSTTFEQVFSNITPFLACDSGGPATYSPTSSDMRRIVMQFNDGAGWQTLPAMSINAVPYAMYANDAQKFNGMQPSEFVQVSTLPTCAASESLRFNGSSFSCIAVGGGSGSVTSGSVLTALGYTPADGASVTAVTASVNSVSSTLASVSSTVYSVSSTVTSLQNSVAASFAAMTNSQWISSGTSIRYMSGFVGIGTANPAYNLHVANPTSGTATIGLESFGSTAGFYSRRANGTAASPSAVSATQALLEIAAVGYGSTNYISTSAAKILMSADENFTDTTGAASIRFHTRGVSSTGSSLERMRVAYNGFVGIGTTSPVTTLDVSGGIRVGTENNSCSASLAGTLRYNAGVVEYCNGTSWAAFGVSGAGILAINGLASGSQTFAFGVNGTTPNVSSTGSVHTFNFPFASVGTTTAGVISNSDYLTFMNKVSAASLTSVTNLINTNSASLTSLTNSVATSYSTLSASIGAITSSQWVTSGSTINYISGFAGIGTSNPSAQLHVYKNTTLGAGWGAWNTASAVTRIQEPTGSLYLDGNSLISDVAGSMFVGTMQAYPLTFGTSDTERMRIDANGNLGLGVANPTAKLEINGAIRFPNTNSTLFYVREATPTGSATTDGVRVSFEDDAFGVNQDAIIFEKTDSNAGVADGGFLFAYRGSSNVRVPVMAVRGANVGFGMTTPATTTRIHIASGSTVTAPLRFTSGVLNTAPQSGAMEYDGTNYYLTDNTNVRRQIFLGSSSSPLSTADYIATNSVTTPNLYGSSVSGGTLRIDSSSNASKGPILLAASATNWVGIGVASAPLGPLHVVGGANPALGTEDDDDGIVIQNFQPTLTFKDSTVGDPDDLRLRMNQTSLFFETSPDFFASSPVTTTLMTLTASGNLGLGNSTPNYNFSIYNASGPAQIELRQIGTGKNDPGRIIVDETNNNAGEFWIQPTDDFDSAGADKFHIGDYDNKVSRFTVTGAGAVGIGTSAPTVRLTVDDTGGTVSAPYAAATDKLAVQGTGNAVIQITTPASGSGAVYFSDPNDRDPGGVGYSHLTDSMYFRVNDATRMTITSGGALGIGVGNPTTARLEVSRPTVSGSQLALFNNSSGGYFTVPSSGNGVILSSSRYDGSNWITDSTSAAAITLGEGTIQFFTNNSLTAGTSHTYTERARFDSNGNFMIGAGASNDKFSVTSNGAAYMAINNTGAANKRTGIFFKSGGSPQFEIGVDANVNGGHDFYIYDSVSGAQRVSISNVGNVGIGIGTASYLLQLGSDSAAKPGTNTWTIASDMRLKDSRAPFTRSINELLGLETIYFKYKKDNPLGLPSDKEYVGIRAQDVQKVIPEAVSTDEKGYLHFTSDPVFWTVVNSVKEIYHKLMSHDEQLVNVNREIASIKEENEKLKQENADKDKQLQDIRVYLCAKDPSAPLCK